MFFYVFYLQINVLTSMTPTCKVM